MLVNEQMAKGLWLQNTHLPNFFITLLIVHRQFETFNEMWEEKIKN